MKKKIIEHNDQKNDFKRGETDFEKSLRAELETTAGVGDLFEDEGVYYYKLEGEPLKEVDFDAFDTEKWMQGAVKRPGALHKRLGIPEDEKIPISLINEKIAALRKKGEGDRKLSEDDRRFLQQLQYAKTARSVSKKKDLITNDEDSDGDDPHEKRTIDSVDESCPLLKNKKQKSAENMKKIEKKTEDMATEEKEMEGYDAEKDKKPKKEEKEEDMKKEDNIVLEATPQPESSAKSELKAEDLQEIINDLVEKKVAEITKDFQEFKEESQKKKITELTDLLQKEPYGFSKEDLDGLNVKDLENKKATIESSKLYKDFIESQKKVEDPMDIDKEIISKSNDFSSLGADPWRTFKAQGGK